MSLLVAASTICERVVLNQLTEYMINKKKITKHQSGNRKLHSVETLNILITDTILVSIDRKELTSTALVIGLKILYPNDTINARLLIKHWNDHDLIFKNLLSTFADFTISDHFRCNKTFTC